MLVSSFNLIGGIGLFLLGMSILVEGLKSFAGDSLRLALIRFTGSPVKALLSGVFVTALVQSSSATTVAVIGFVSAGLLTFSQSLGVVLGASLGTTSTSWIVSVLGLKVSISLYALPVIGIGAFINLLASGRWKSLGLAMAGFGLIFVGIDTLQRGMGGISEMIDVSVVSYPGIFGHLLTMLIGVAMTVVMQSSSAAVATTLTALHTASITFEQAASLVIGCAVGTTVTGAIAAIGGSTSAKRTALAHVVFNLATGLIAITLLPMLLWLLKLLQQEYDFEPGAMSLAAFHTAFIGIGVLIFLPFIDRLALIVERMLPEKESPTTAYLDKTLLTIPSVALEATRRALAHSFLDLIVVTRTILSQQQTPALCAAKLREISASLQVLQEFFAKIPPSDDVTVAAMRESTLHALDHLVRFDESLRSLGTTHQYFNESDAGEMVARCLELLDGVENLLDTHIPTTIELLEWVASQSGKLRDLRSEARLRVMRQTAKGIGDPLRSLEMLDAMRWIDRVGYHTWRICNYLATEPKAESEETAEVQTA